MMGKSDFNALYEITYGLYIVASANNSQKSGFIANAVMQLTPNPIQIAVCCCKENFTTKLIQESKKASLSVLNINTPITTIKTFGYSSGDKIDKFNNIKYFTTDNNIPVVTENCNAWITATTIKEIDFGSHILFIMKIDEADLLKSETPGLTYSYYREVFKGKSPRNAPSFIDSNYQNTERTSKNTEININNLKIKNMGKKEIWVCNVCGYEYNPADGDPDSGIAPGTAFEDIPDDWVCPLCGVSKSDFSKK